LTFLPLRRPLANDAKVVGANCTRAAVNCLYEFDVFINLYGDDIYDEIRQPKFKIEYV